MPRLCKCGFCMASDRINVSINSSLNPKGFRDLKKEASQVKQIFADIAKAQAQAFKGSGGNGSAAALKAQAAALKSQTLAARAATAESKAQVAAFSTQAAAARAAAAQETALTASTRRAAAEATAAAAAIRRQAQEQQRAAAAAKASVKEQEQAIVAARRVEAGTLALAQAQAKAHIAAGNTAEAESILSAALEKVDKSSLAAVRAQTQLAQIQNQTGQSTQESASQFNAFHEITVGALRGIGVAAVQMAGQVIQALGSAVASAFDFAGQSVEAQKNLQAEFGLTADEAERLNDVAANLFVGGVGGSIGEVSEMVALARQQLGLLNETDLSNVTNGAAAVADTFDSDYSQVINAVKSIKNNFPGTTEAQALDLITKGFQNGLNASGDLLESITEYSPQFGGGSASAQQFFGIMQSGLKGGVLGTDKIADAFKEFNLRILDGSDATKKALDKLGLTHLIKDLNQGKVTAADALGFITQKLSNVDEATKRQTGVALLGTQFEDLGFDVDAYSGIVGTAFSNIEGATNSLQKKYETLGSMWENTKRQGLDALEPIGELGISIGQRLTPAISALIKDSLKPGIKSFADFASAAGGSDEALANLSPKAQALAKTIRGFGEFMGEGKLDNLFSGLTDILGPEAAGNVVSALDTIKGAFADFGDTELSKSLQSGLSSVSDYISGPFVDDVTSGIATVINKLAEFGDTPLGEALKEQASSIGSYFADEWPGDFQRGVDVVRQSLDSLAQTPWAQDIQQGASVVGSYFANEWPGDFGRGVEAVKGALSGFANDPTVQGVWTDFKEGASVAGSYFANEFPNDFRRGADTASAALSQWVTDVQEGAGVVASVWQTVVAGVLTFAADFQRGLNTVVLAVQQWGTDVQEGATVVQGAIETTIANIKASFDTFIATASSIGTDFVNGVASGITGGAGAIRDAAVNAAQNALNAATSFLDSHSPSRKTAAEIGEPFSQGIGVGITKGAPAAVKAAGKVAKDTAKVGAVLLELQQKTNDKLLDIQTKAGERLLEIDARIAEDRKKARAELSKDIRSSQADADFDFSANDLDQFEAETDEQKNQYKIREAAEKQYQQRMQAARDEARRTAAEGDAELAKEILAAKEKEAQALLELDQRYMQLRATVDKGQLPALEKEYQDAVEELRARTNVEVDIARSGSDERAKAVEAEKAAVVSEAQKASNEVILEAQKQADGVKNATDVMVSSIVSGWQVSARAIDETTAAVNRYRDAISGLPSPPSGGGSSSGGGSADVRAAGGVTFVSNGPGTLKYGDNPGGAELVQVTPLSGKGQTRVGSGANISMAGGGAIVAGQGVAGRDENVWQEANRARDARLAGMKRGGSSFDISEIDPSALDAALQRLTEIGRIVDQAARRNRIDPGSAKKFAETTAIIAQSVQAVVELRSNLTTVDQTPIDVPAVVGLLTELTQIADIFETAIGARRLNVGLLDAYSEGISAAMETINTMIEVRKNLKDPGPSVDLELVQALAAESRIVTRIVQNELIKLYQEERDALAQGAEALESSTSILSAVIDLRDSAKELGPPLMLERLQEIAAEANEIVLLLQNSINPTTIQAREELAAFAENVGQVVDTFSAIMDLRNGLAEPQFPIAPSAIESLVDDTFTVAQAVASLVPEGFAAVAGLEEYAGTAEQAVSVLTNMADLRERLTTLDPPVSLPVVEQLAAELRRVVMYFQSSVIPYEQQMTDTIGTYAESAGKSVDALLAMADLRKVTAEPLAPISEQAVERLAFELRKSVIWFQSSVIPYEETMAAAIAQYVDIAGGAIDTLTAAAELGKNLGVATPIPIDIAHRLADQVHEVTTLFQQSIVPYTEQQADDVSRYASIAGDAIGTLNDAAELGKNLTEATPIPLDKVKWLAEQTKAATETFETYILARTEEQADTIGRYASITSDMVGTLSDAAGLGEALKAALPIPMDTVRGLSAQAQHAADIFEDSILVRTEEQADDVARYASIASDSISTLSDVAGLGESLKAFIPLSEDKLRHAAADTRRVTSIFLDDLLPVTEEQSEAASLYADAAGSATSAIQSTLGLTSQMFADYTSPADSDIQRIIADGDRFIAGMTEAAARYETEGLEAANTYAQALGSTVDALTGTGQLVEALRYGNEYLIDPGVLTQFKESSREILAIGAELGALAAQNDYSGLTAASSALSGWYDSLTKGASVPWGDLPTMAGAMGGSGGNTSYGPTSVTVNLYTQPGQNAQEIATIVLNRLNQSVAGRRT